MRDSMATMRFETVDEILLKLLDNNLDLDVKLVKAAQVLHLKLEKEKEINQFIDSLHHVPNYKTIKKSVSSLEEKVQQAKELEVEINPEILNIVNSNIARLISERNLQFQMEKVKISLSEDDDVKTLEDLIHKAKATGVASEYTDRADIYLDKMTRSIRARDIVKLFEVYPTRDYPEVEEVDPKNKNKKTAEPPKKKKKKKKATPFGTPDWALTLDAVKEETKTLEVLVQDHENLELKQEFLDRTEIVLERFKKKEIPFREEEERVEAEKEALKKAKKGNKGNKGKK
mmetsp:Transcript_23460/g.26025  ORF Transcript_23460/g.26025 Transcript_23460/m.26025 type:complete len:287 (+) Transcript_23460:203-1063(+)